MRKILLIAAWAFLFAPALPHPVAAQSSTSWAVTASNQYRVVSDVTYGVAGGTELKLDVYQRRGVEGPQPTVIYMHGGFWAAGTKEGALMSLLPWLEMGWNVVNVEYRLARVALAPAAVEDCLCALRYIAAQAEMYNVDTGRIVLTGESAGGHLSLTTGIIPESARLDLQCAGAPLPRVAAIVNWFGVTDVADVIDGPHRANLAAQWMGSLPNWREVARRVSPLTYVREGVPPVMTIHGDMDQLVPYDHAVRLHAALDKVGVPNRLMTVAGGGHGRFSDEQRIEIFAAVRDFVGLHVGKN
jgi:acetyl esterase/lipase